MEIKYPGSYSTPPEDKIDMNAVEEAGIQIAMERTDILDIVERYYRGGYSAVEMAMYLDAHRYKCTQYAEQEAEEALQPSEDDYLEGA